MTAVIFREDLPAIYERLELEVQSYLNPPSPVISPDDSPNSSTEVRNYFDEISFIRSQSLANSILTMSTIIDSTQIIDVQAGRGKMDILLLGSKNTIFPVDTIGNILNYSLRQLEGEDLYEFGYLVQYDAYLNKILYSSDSILLSELLEYLDTLKGISINQLDPFSRNAIEHTPIVISANSMSSIKNILNYMLLNGSNLVLEKAIIRQDDKNKQLDIRFFITYLNYSDS